MKYVINIILTVLISLLGLSSLCAQDIDAERMNRDITIAENILEEMFKTKWEARGNRVHVKAGNFSFGGSASDINGMYLQDYGVIFTIPGGPPAFLIFSDKDGDASSYSFSYGAETDREVNKETILKRIREFLRDYGSTIGQLGNNEHITIIYGGKSPAPQPIEYVFSQADKPTVSTSDIPSSIYVTARKSDLEAFRKGSISQSEFDNRLQISTDEEERRDLKIMSNILKSTFEDAGRDAYRIRSSVRNTYIDNLGALFYLDASYGSGLFALNAAVIRVRNEIKKLDRDDTTSVWLSRTPDDDEDQDKINQARAEAYTQFLQQLKETLVDYGRTLKSVQSDEQVYVSVSISSSGGEVPERVDLQIKKSVLEAVDSGNMSRDRAIREITVREY